MTPPSGVALCSGGFMWIAACPVEDPMEYPKSTVEPVSAATHLRERDVMVTYRKTVSGGMTLDVWKSLLQKAVRRNVAEDALLALANILSVAECVTLDDGRATMCKEALPKITNLFHRVATILCEDVGRDQVKYKEILTELEWCHGQKDAWKAGLPVEQYKQSVEEVFVRLARALTWMCSAPKCREASVLNARFPYGELQESDKRVKHPLQDTLLETLRELMSTLGQQEGRAAREHRVRILHVRVRIMRLYPKKKLANGKWSFHGLSTHGAVLAAVDIVKAYSSEPALIDILAGPRYLRRTFMGKMDQYLYHWKLVMFCIAGDEKDPLRCD